ncbi:MAG: alpha/beta hydrolase [Pseudomonadota bacterium]
MSETAYQHLIKPPTTSDAPVVFAFHGTGGDEHQFFDLIDRELPGAGIVSPRGDVSEMGANRFFRRTGEGVYDMDDLAARTSKMAGFIAAHKAATAGHPVFGLGYSNGANILAAVAFKHADLFDRICLMHPLIPWTPADNDGLSRAKVLVTAGERDTISPISATETLVEYFRKQGSETDTSFHSGGHEVRAEEIGAVVAFLKADHRSEAA